MSTDVFVVIYLVHGTVTDDKMKHINWLINQMYLLF